MVYIETGNVMVVVVMELGGIRGAEHCVGGEGVCESI